MNPDNLTNLLKDKSVALVGSAKYLSDFSFGKEIDDHDVVVRINKGIDILDEKSFKLFGRKTDILYHCLLEDPKDTNGPKFGFIEPVRWKGMGVKNVFCLPNSNMLGQATGNHLSSLVNVDNIKKIQDHLTLSIVDYRFYNSIAASIECKPNTGIVALCHLLSMSPKKLSVYGFSFLLDGWIKEYRSGIEKLEENIKRNLTIEQISENSLNSKRHNQKNQWEFVKNINNQYSNFSPDPYMEKILLMSDFKKENLKDFDV